MRRQPDGGGAALAMRWMCFLAAATLTLRGATLAAQAQSDSAPKATRPHTAYEDMQMFSQVLNQIRVNHPDSIDTHELIMAAVEGMVRAADPHSYVMRGTKLSAEKAQAMRDGKLYPVPVRFTFIEGAAIVVNITPGSDVSRLDILIGDELIAIDGNPVSAESPGELEAQLLGAKNSMAKLTLERRRVDGSLVSWDLLVRRQKMEEEDGTAVPAVFLLDANTGYIRVTSFMSEKVADDLHRALGQLESRGASRIVLDLRENGGGRVDLAARIAGEFLPSGALVYTSEGRKREVTDTGRVSRSFWKSERDYPLVLMIDAGTASASELVAGALQDHDRALILGRPSFGKALLMFELPLMDGAYISYIALVVGHVKTPCGRVIQRQYHAMAHHEYYRLAGTARDTVGRPSCKTDHGRTVYGGGGIYPDILVPERPLPPAWLVRVREEQLPLKWLPGYVSANSAAFPSLEALAAKPEVPGSAITQFRDFAKADSIEIPSGAEADSVLNRLLVRGVARVKWGDVGYYRMAAMFDPDVALAVQSFDRTSALLGPKH